MNSVNNSGPPSAQFGSAAEMAVALWLVRAGFVVLDRNWRRPWGEIDIVARRNGVLRFIEVKASARELNGFEPFLRADRNKIAKVARTARTWLAAHGMGNSVPWQMDIISVIMSPDGPIFTHFENI